MSLATVAFAARVLRRLAVATAAALVISATLASGPTSPVDGTDAGVCQPIEPCVAVLEPTPHPRGSELPAAPPLPAPGPTLLLPDLLATPAAEAWATEQPGKVAEARPGDQAGPTRPPDSDQSEPPAPDPTEKPGATLAFAEECSGGLGSAWHALYGHGDPGYAEDADFMGDLRQVSVANGRCRITATRANTPSGAAYASAAMATKGNFSQRYGTFEVRVRYPAGQGMWPAFLLLRQQAVVTTPPEIDVFEAYPAPPGAGGGSGRNVSVSTLHSANGIHYFVDDHGSDMTTDFHTFRMTWSPGKLVFWIDGVETGRITQDVPDVAMFPVLALAVGAPGYRADESTPDTAVMEIDYLRVWED